MKFFNQSKRFGRLCRIMAIGLMFGLSLSACSDDDEIATSTIPFDPSKPVVITSFTPESGGSQDDIIVNGQNFGTDKDKVELTIGGKPAIIVNVMSDKLYAFVPPMAFGGDIVLTIYDNDGVAHTAVADSKFVYEAQDVVGTLCGYQNDNDSQGEVMGSFDTCAGFASEGTLSIDPLYPDRLYMVMDGGNNGNKIVQLDLAKRETSKLMSSVKFQGHRLRNLAFSNDGKYMLVSTDRDDNGFASTSVWIVTRNSDGTFSDASSCQRLVAYKQCNGVAVHPVNGEVYFNSYSNGELFRMELDDYFASFIPDPETGELPEWTGLKDEGFTELFKIQDPSFEFQMVIHPSGNYAYITVINKNYILRTDYNWTKKEFTTPYVVTGMLGVGDWVDAVGTNARMNRPYQGVFVKNQKYVEEGREDVYDYYFADCLNFCVRYITPEGIVRTYAGRAPSTNGNIWGTEDGGLRTAARFRDVTGITYDEVRERFYVLDHNNRRIRTIGKESDDLINNGGSSDETDEGEGSTEGEESAE